MPEFRSLEKPSEKEIKELIRKLEGYPKIKPRLTFPFVLNERRKSSLEMLRTGKINLNKVIELLKSDDFVEIIAGLYFLKRVSLSEENKKIIFPILRNLSKYNLREIRKLVAQVLENFGEEAMPILKKLSNDEDVFVRMAAAQAIVNIIVKTKSEEKLAILEELSRDSNQDIRKSVAQALRNFGEEAIPVLEKLSRDYSPFVRAAAAKSLGNLGKKTLPILERLSRDEDDSVRAAVAKTLENFGEEAMPILEELSKDDNKNVIILAVQTKIKILAKIKNEEELFIILDSLAKDKNLYVRLALANALGNLGEKALPILEILSRDEHPLVREAVARSLSNLGKKALRILENLTQDSNWEVRKAAKLSIAIIRGGGYKYLISTQKPLFATPETEALIKRIRTLEEIVERLKNKFGDRFIGLVVFGSTAKGYFTKESDFDGAIIATDKSVLEEFEKMGKAESINLDIVYYVEVNPENEILKCVIIGEEGELLTDEEVLFCGIFFGDPGKLKEIQKRAIQSMTRERWDNIREEIMREETDLEKLCERLKIPEEEMERLILSNILLRVPPSYNEAKKLLGLPVQENDINK
jgi:HEAT repeat protein